MKVINLFAGPGAGKSTLAAGLFYDMKMSYVNCELVTEYAKDLTWEKRNTILEDQLYVMSKQNRRLDRLRGQIDWVITDSPLLLGAVYDSGRLKTLPKLLDELWNSYDNINYFLHRKKKYVSSGRNQTYDEAVEIDRHIADILYEYQVPYEEIEVTGDKALDFIKADLVENHELILGDTYNE